MFNQELEAQLKKEISQSKKTGTLAWQKGMEEVFKNQAMMEVIHRLAKC